MKTLNIIIAVFRLHRYGVYTRPLKLNIVGIRSESTTPNRFDDFIVVFFKDNNGKWVLKIYPATTDPGTYWLYNPMAPQGTAILAQGRYEGAYQIGYHRGQYQALVQTGGPLTILRDYDRNAVLDFNNGNPITGYFGINIHRVNSSGTTMKVDKYSAGCQVFQKIDDFNEFMRLCEAHKNLYGNRFTYTLIDTRAMKRTTKRHLMYGLIAASAIAGVGTALVLASNNGGIK